MRIGLISDLHIDINKDYPIVELTAETAAEQMTDVLVIAGDISETQNQTLQAIERLQSLCEFPVYYVPGNHDMWNKNCPECTTEEIDRIYREDLRCFQVSRLFWRRMAGNWLWWVMWAGMIIPWHHRNIQEMFWMV